jgi:uncharacterized membrane protein (UPF0127 family)
MIMKIFNVTKNKWIAENAALAEKLVSRMIGLLGRKSLPNGCALIIRPCKGVHTCFMRFPIDCLFINQEHVVLHVIGSLQPWRISPMVRGSWCVIELPAGAAIATGTETGDQLEII